LLSAPQGKQRLAIQSAAQVEWICSDGKSENLRAIASTLSQRRAHHDFRAAFVVSSYTEAAETLRSFSQGIETRWSSQGRSFDNNVSKAVVWVFSGHGAQWAKMGLELLEDPLFYHTLAPLDLSIKQELGYSAIDSLRSGTFEASDEIQVLTYLVQVGLAQVLRSKGTHPEAVIGHSVGEIAASVTAGCLTMEEGTVLVTRRARLYAKVKDFGGMYLVYLPLSEVSAELSGARNLVAAIDSSPFSCVISGAIAPLNKYVECLNSRGVKTFRVKTDIPFHSSMLDDLSKPLEDALSGVITPRPAVIRLYSTSQADVRSTASRDAKYWIQNMVGPVWLTNAVRAATGDSYRIFLEISTRPIVSQSIEETLYQAGLSNAVMIPTMRKDQSAGRSILHAIAQLHIKGVNIDFPTLLGREWKLPPKVYHLYVRKSDIHDDQRTRSVDVSAIGSRGEVLLQIESMRLAEVDADSKSSTGMNGLVYRIAWTPAHLAEKPLFLGNVVMISPEDRILQHYGDQLDPHVTELKKFRTADTLNQVGVASFLRERGSAVVYCPGPVESFTDVSTSSHGFIWQIAMTVKFIVENGLSAKVFIITDKVYAAGSATALAQGPLLGLARVVASEH
jgi:acyl transferase domain-containing protein